MVEINPFVWNGCELTVDKNPGEAYSDWARKWIDVGDEKTPTMTACKMLSIVSHPRKNITENGQ